MDPRSCFRFFNRIQFVGLVPWLLWAICLAEIRLCLVNGVWEGEAPAEPSKLQRIPYIAAQQELRPPEFECEIDSPDRA